MCSPPYICMTIIEKFSFSSNVTTFCTKFERSHHINCLYILSSGNVVAHIPKGYLHVTLGSRYDHLWEFFELVCCVCIKLSFLFPLYKCSWMWVNTPKYNTEFCFCMGWLCFGLYQSQLWRDLFSFFVTGICRSVEISFVLDSLNSSSLLVF